MSKRKNSLPNELSVPNKINPAMSGSLNGDVVSDFEQLQTYSEFVEGTSDLLTQVDNKGRFLFVNSTSNDIFGLALQDCIGLSAFDFIHPDDVEATN